MGASRGERRSRCVRGKLVLRVERTPNAIGHRNPASIAKQRQTGRACDGDSGELRFGEDRVEERELLGILHSDPDHGHSARDRSLEELAVCS